MFLIFRPLLFFILISELLFGEISGNLKVCAIKVSFTPDSKLSTTGNGTFLKNREGIDCGDYSIDKPPHDNQYFYDQIKSVNSYYQNVSGGILGIDTESSLVYPLDGGSYELENDMSYYHPYGQDSLHNNRLVSLFKHSIELALVQDNINLDLFDLVVIFHAGLGQDFSLPFLDQTPEDIPSTFIDGKMILKYNDSNLEVLEVGEYQLNKGIILPETQNYLNYDESLDLFNDDFSSCDLQYSLTGTFALMVGFAIGLPPLWDTDSGGSRIGVFGLMDQGSNNGKGIIPSPPNPWSRIYAGWSNYTSVSFYNNQLSLSNSLDNILKINLNDSEYYLVENKNNSAFNGISIDSIKYKKILNDLPTITTVEIVFDSLDITIGSSGVITSVNNYDIGLPGSGLAIWHVDENIINSNLGNYTINQDIKNKGIDLEESDGAQDIGYPSFFMFSDPSSGYFGDLWFDGNNEYERANGFIEDSLPVFNSFTYPNTNTNDGSSSFISINNISSYGDTMFFNVTNRLVLYTSADNKANIKTSFNNIDDATINYIGGEDSLWFSRNGDIMDKLYFHNLKSNNYFIIQDVDSSIENSLLIVEQFENETKKSKYVYNQEIGFFLSDQTVLDSLQFSYFSAENNQFITASFLSWLDYKSHVYSNNNIYTLNNDGLGISVKILENNTQFQKYENIKFETISGVDLNLNTKVDALCLDINGVLHGFNQDLVYLPGFPSALEFKSPILSKDILGDNKPEIIAKSKDSRHLYILNSKGEILHQISSLIADDLVEIAYTDNENFVILSNTIYQFNHHNINNGNFWLSENGSQNNSREVDINYSFSLPNNKIIQNAYAYPSPAKNGYTRIRVESFNAEEIILNLYNFSGSHILKFKKIINGDGVKTSEFYIDLTPYESGVYFARLEVGENNKYESRVVKFAVSH